MRTEDAVARVTVTCSSTIGLPASSRMTRLVTPKPLPVSTTVDPSCTEASAISGIADHDRVGGARKLDDLGLVHVTSMPATGKRGTPWRRDEQRGETEWTGSSFAIAALQTKEVFNGR